MIGRGPDKAGTAGDRSSMRLLELGDRLVPALVRCLKLTGMHDRRNRAHDAPLNELLEIVRDILTVDSRWELRLRHEHLKLCDLRIRIDVDSYLGYHYLVDEFRKTGVGALGIHAPPPRDRLLDLLYAFREASLTGKGGNPFEVLETFLAKPGMEFMYLEALVDESEDIPRDEDIRQRAITTFFKAIYLARGILGAVGSQRVVHVRRAKRLVASMVDILNFDETALLGLTNIKNFDDYTFNHSVNVCVLSLAVGRRIGLSNAQLGDLGLAALFHDIGKMSIPSDLLNKVGTLEDAEFELLRRHPVEGVKQLIRLKGLSSATAKLMISVFRHHNNVNGTGYPALGRNEELSLSSRIIRIVDSYDAMTSRRIYRRGTLNNVEAIEELWNLAGTSFDTVLLKVFISTVGIFPPGSLVQLASGEIAIVIRNADSPEHLFHPVVKTLASWGDGPHDQETIDLSVVREKSIYGYFQSSSAEEVVNSLLL